MVQKKHPKIDGDRLREIRVSKPLTLRGLEEVSGVSYDRISKLEVHGGSARASTIHKLAAALNVDPSELVKS